VLLAYGIRRKSSRYFDRPSPDRPYAQKAIGLTVLVPKSIFVFPIDQASGSPPASQEASHGCSPNGRSWFMPQERHSNVLDHSGFHEPRGKRMPQIMEPVVILDLCLRLPFAQERFTS
jgi:hypothetical protein